MSGVFYNHGTSPIRIEVVKDDTGEWSKYLVMPGQGIDVGIVNLKRRKPKAPPRKPARECCHCKKPIRIYDKWHFIYKEIGTVMRHRHCDNPTSYYPKKGRT